MSLIDQRRLFTRLDELVRDGYLRRDLNHPSLVVLTFKGLDVLVSFADRPINKTELKKETRESERAAAVKGSDK